MENQRMSTCHRLELQTLGYGLVLPKIKPPRALVLGSVKTMMSGNGPRRP